MSTRTIRVGDPAARVVPVSEVVMTEMRDGAPCVHLRSEVAFGVTEPWLVAGVKTEAELLAALGWSSAPPPPHPTARTLLDVLRDLHVGGALAACHYGDDAPLDHAVSEWADAGYPGARRSTA